MFRKILSISAGLFLGVIIMLIFSVLARSAFIFPENYQWLNPKDMGDYIDGLPDRAFVLIISSHVLGVFLATLLTSLISLKQRFSNGIITGAILFVLVMVLNFTFDFPRFYLMIDTLATAVGAFAGSSFGQGRKV